MQDPEYFVYYSTTNNRPRKHFGRDRQAAIKWAEDNRHKDTEVIECHVIWSRWSDR